MTLTRRELIEAAIATGAVGLVAACGGGGAGASVDCPADGPTATIAGNHGHILAVPANDVQAGAAKTYDFEGSSGHSHQVTVSAADFTKLQDNTTVEVTSTSVNMHTHTVTLNCG